MDFFSLDIEGAEMDVLRTIPFHLVDIELFLIEVTTTLSEFNPYVSFYQTNKANVTEMSDFMSKQGYEATSLYPIDHLFIKKQD